MSPPPDYAELAKLAHAISTHLKDNPNDAEARDDLAGVVELMQHAARGEGEQEANAADKLSLGKALGVEALHGAGMGTGELFSGIGSAIRGRGFKSGANQYRSAVNASEEEAPILGPTTEMITGLAPSAIGGALSAGKAGIQVGKSIPWGQVIARGAGTGGVLGGVQGLASGAGGQGDLKDRLQGAGMGAAQGSILGALFGGLSAPQMKARAVQILKEKTALQRAANSEKQGRLLDMRLRKATRTASAPSEPVVTSSPVAPREPIPDEIANLPGRPARPAPLDADSGPVIEPSTGHGTYTPMNLETPGYRAAVERAAKAAAKDAASNQAQNSTGDVLKQAIAKEMAGKKPNAMEIPTYLRRGGYQPAPAENGPTGRIGAKVNPARPELGTYSAPGPYQKAGPAIRVESPSVHGIPLGDLKAAVELARSQGNTDEQILNQIVRRYPELTGDDIRQAFGTEPKTAQGGL